MRDAVTNTMNDPYPLPFPWGEDLRNEHWEFGLLPCDCQAGWLPLLSGDWIQCPSCAGQLPCDEAWRAA